MKQLNMIWSRYNYLFNSIKFGYFLYNSRTNSFLKPNKELYNIFTDIKEGTSEINKIDEDLLQELTQLKVLVKKSDDDNFIVQQQYLKYTETFSKDSLGLVIAPTTFCNFECPYCYELGMEGKSMSEDTERDIINFIHSFGKKVNLDLGWHGGEPLLRFDSIKRLLESIVHDDKIDLRSHSLVTNGFLFDKEKCDFLIKHKLDSVQITIDGLEETHNNSRKHKSGEPTYFKIRDNIDYILDNYPKCLVLLRVNIHDDNQEDFPILFKELSERWKNKNCKIYFTYATDHGSCNVGCLQNNNKVKFLIDLYKKYNIKDVQFYPKRQIGGCTADSSNSFVVGPKGELYKCWVDLGKLDRSIGDITNDNINLDLMSEYMVGTDKFSDAKCKECFLFPVCDGGCGLFRLEHKFHGKEYNVCPIDVNDIDLILEAFYEQTQEKVHATQIN